MVSTVILVGLVVGLVAYLLTLGLASITVRRVFSYGAETPLDYTETITADNVLSYSLSVPTATTDQQVLIAVTLAAMKAYYIVSDKAITIETNATDATGGDTIVLVANQPIMWTTGSPAMTKHFTQNITTMYITNASGATATIEIRFARDATP